MQLILPARPPFSLASVTNSHGWVMLAPFAREGEAGAFTYVGQLPSGRVYEMRVSAGDGSLPPNAVQVDLGAGLDDAETAGLARQVTWMLGLDQDFADFYSLAEGEPHLARAAERAQGRILRSATFFEDVVKTILTTNTTWAGTMRMVRGLVDLYGDPLPADPSRHAFPTAQRLAALDEAALRGEARLGFRAPSVLALARDVASGSLDIEGLKSGELPTPELRKQLLRIRGVGDYAAAHLLILLERYDYLPVDSWALKVVSKEWHGSQPVGRAEVEAAFARWGKWQGLAYWCWDWS